MRNDLLTLALTSKGEVYGDVRAELVEEGEAAVEALEAQVQSTAADEQRWIAEIVQHRIAHPDGLHELEQEFHTKVFSLNFGYPNPRQVGIERLHFTQELLVPDEPTLSEKSPDTIQRTWGDFTPQVKAYFETLRISESSLWTLLLGEVLLKGWVPSVPVHDPESAFPFRSGRSTPLHSEDYVIQAMALLGKLGERRAGSALLRFLQDEQQLPSYRAFAAYALGRLQFKESLPMLLGLCQSGRTPGGLQLAAFEALVLMKDLSIMPELEQIAKSPEAKGRSIPLPTNANVETRREYAVVDARTRASHARWSIRRLQEAVASGTADLTP